MRAVVLGATLVAVVIVLTSLQALVDLARRLPLEPRARRARPVLGSGGTTGRGDGGPRPFIGAVRGPGGRRSGRPSRRSGWSPGRSGAAPGGPGLNDLRQLESLCQRALLGEVPTVDRLAGRIARAAEACGLPPRSVPAAAHQAAPDLLAALEGVERGIGGADRP